MSPIRVSYVVTSVQGNFQTSGASDFITHNQIILQHRVYKLTLYSEFVYVYLYVYAFNTFSYEG